MPVTSASPFTLPDPSTVESVFKALSNAHDTVEKFIWQINRVTACEAVVIEEDKVDDLAPITFEGIGVVASVLADLDMARKELEEFSECLRGAIPTLGAIRS